MANHYMDAPADATQRNIRTPPVVGAAGFCYRQDGGLFEVQVPGTTTWVPMQPVAGAARVLRTRVTLAQVNAGLTLLAAVPGYKYRMHDMALIAIGGNAGGVTGVSIVGTQATSAVLLMNGLVAGLTRSTLLRAGAATNGVILADGASFVACDANTAITVIKDGSDLTTATHIDVLLTYTLEAA